MPSRSGPAGTQAVSRALTLLKSFGGERTEWAIGDLARSLGLHKSTALRLLQALEHEEMLVRDAATGTFRLGPATIALGFRALHSADLQSMARPELEALVAATGETATLEIMVGDDVLIIDEVQSHHAVGVAPEIGTRWPAHATSTGKVLLAARPAAGATRRMPARARLERITPRTITSTRALARELEKVRSQGYGLTVGELETWFTALAAPVRNHEGRVIAALGVGGPSERLGRDRIRALSRIVRSAAARVSRRLGAPALAPD